jgi:hypothetical protein
MTICEAIDSGIRFVRKRGWESHNYVELPPKLPNGLHGPWAKVGVCDPDGVPVPAEYDLEVPVFLGDIDDGADDWEPADIKDRPSSTAP